MKTLLAFLALWVCLIPTSLAEKGEAGSSPCEKIDSEFLTLAFPESDIAIFKDVVYTDIGEVHIRHKLDLYVPPIRPECPHRPMIMIIHGGGFIAGDKNDMEGAAMLWARRGYMVAVPNYRLNICRQVEGNCNGCGPDQDCFDFGSTCNRCDYGAATSVHGTKSLHIIDRNWYKATQDCLAALRFSHAWFTNLGVGIIKTFVMGKSAGAITALHLTYASQAEIANYDPDIDDDLGLLTDKVHSGLINYNVTIDGIAEVAGALMDPDFINNNDSAPLIMFHGDCDETVPYCRTNCVNPGVKNGYGSRYIAHHIVTTPVTTVDFHLYSFINNLNGHQTFHHGDMMRNHMMLFFSFIITGQATPTSMATYDVGTGSGPPTYGTNTPPCN